MGLGGGGGWIHTDILADYEADGVRRTANEDPHNPGLITIEGTMQLCEDLEIDPSSVSIGNGIMSARDPIIFSSRNANMTGSSPILSSSRSWVQDSWRMAERFVDQGMESYQFKVGQNR